VHLSPIETARLLLAVLLLLSAAHGFGYAFVRLKQPRVVGEIVGGLVLGPTVLGGLFPGIEQVVFGAPVTAHALGAAVQLGLQLLMFVSGIEFHSTFERQERRTAIFVSVTGTVLPFIGGLAMVRLANIDALLGTAGSVPALVIVLAVGVAVTSIPVISRIMMDLGIIATPFARVVLGAAVIEDLVLYVALAVAIGLVSGKSGDMFGVPSLLGLDSTRPGAASAYYVITSLVFFAGSLVIGPPLFRRIAGSRYNVLRRSNPLGALLAFMLAMTGFALVIGVASMFGAFLAGVIVGAASSPGSPDRAARRDAIKQFSLAFFVPIYFAVVGLRLDLRRDFDLRFFLFFAAYAAAWKGLSIFAGARAAGESNRGATNLAVAMNARGGPGIVLASVAYDAGIISGSLYATLVVFALVSSMAAGAWLGRQVRAGKALL
jgi:Kef-type K+ transport system membrane component KefB